MTSQPMLTVQQCAERLNCHHSLVRRLITSGKLTASRLGKEWRIEPDDLEAFIAGRRHQPIAPRSDLDPLPALAVRRFM
jgi:excisionase family DNA binding protein